ncbi:MULTISPECIES: UDP-glucose 4-epimerase GalE [Clostridium]|uniref:UDP-glucose 4-epimerase GalE n=1 Tax=Clostridium TaxID=1485 RepID=UPI0029050ABF|nr:UDP-glucose 4-epimerase GalE [Clostridium sp.]MDU1968936.1 UDP-glucose 4-epimerase GalE [Clostridium perfringens]MDU1824548.1 UDP-glucose 4-epimerase GalE [Clostridium sp.]MDU1842065.1 UDP-glucose 4-epimerase GalE [Clostridium sp.]MDU1978889.1 UDP-glucose 4-epimerase GalE [Clostridium sp.]MDU1994319.1 UDP-glucose 4-epimerase GalE [Clostridium sp.]
MSILVAGGTGYIGSHTCIELINAGYEVIIVDNFCNSKPEVLKRIEELSNAKPKFYEVDVLDREALSKVFDENNIEAVINFAGLKAVGESVEKPIEYYNNNITGTLVLCDVMRKYNVKKLVFSSSATVYGMENKVPFNEEMPTASATNPYGSTKLFIEQILKDIFISDNEWSIALLRYFNPIGAHESGRIGEDPNGIPNNLMPYITQVAVGKRKELSVFGNDYETHDGTGVRDYIHVVDLAKGHLKAVGKVLNSKGVEAYNLGTGIGYSVLDVVNSFEKASGKKVPYKVVERRAGDIGTCYADATKALRELGWKAEKDLDDMCMDSWRWQKNNPNGYEK